MNFIAINARLGNGMLRFFGENVTLFIVSYLNYKIINIYFFMYKI